MQRNDVASVVVIVANGASLVETSTELFCAKKSVRQSEFYAAQQVGLNPQFVLVFDLDDYESTYQTLQGGTIAEPKEVTFRGTRYNIIRTYEPNNYEIEVTIGRQT